MIRRKPILIACLLFTLPLGGCAAALFGGVAAVATSAREERPVDVALDDLALQAKLEGNLIAEDGALFRRVNTTVIEGRVFLKGRVPREDDRRNATRIAWATPGVREVTNDILVAEPETVGDALTDFWTTTKVRAALLGEGDVKDVNYTIESRDGVVYLMGIAQDNYERQLAVDTARGVEGVVRVVDYLVLKDDPNRPASALAEFEASPRGPLGRTDKGQSLDTRRPDPPAADSAPPAPPAPPATGGRDPDAPIEIRPLPAGS